MAEENRTRRLAILIDADNTSPRIAAGLFEEVAKFGEASVRRIYGDFSGQRLKSWADILQKYAIDPYQQFAYTTGKNASDIALVIDAMDLLHSGRFDGFCLVSSDSDFTRLASRLRENRVPMSTASASRRHPRVSGRRAASSFTPRTCYPRPRFRLPKRGFHQSPAAAQRGHSHLEQGHDADGDGRWLGRLGRGGATPREHRLRLRPAHLWLSKTERSGPKDRSVRY